MSVVTLVSGGLDSTLMAVLARESNVKQFPLFIDYGQISKDHELSACRNVMRAAGLPEPVVADLGGYGALVKSGLTDHSLHVMEDAFTPGRNLMFLLIGAAYGYTVGAEAVAIGLLSEKTSLFPDQTSKFLSESESLLSLMLSKKITVLAPLMGFSKQDVIRVAQKKRIEHTYSCHAGGDESCGVCIACREFYEKED